MKLSFTPLQTQHFPLLLEWLNTEHVRKWWESDIKWDIDLIYEKYNSYVEGYKEEEGKKKPLHAYIFSESALPLGYIQYYDLYNFKRDESLPLNLPLNAAGLDFYVGNANYLNKGYGRKALEIICKKIIWKHFDYCIVDPEIENQIAIRTYKSAGFKKFIEGKNVVWMVKSKASVEDLP